LAISLLLAAFLLVPTVGCTNDIRVPLASAAAATTTDKREITVYVTRTGQKYHRGSCRHLARSKFPMPLSEAKRAYDPCKVCSPPR
jgi:biopolymer transport protein ExbD